MPATRNPRAHTVARRWRIPPPLRGAVAFDGPEGLPILEEIGGALGSLVWGTLRTVTAWIDTPLEERSGMFPESAARRRMAEVLAASPPEVIETALTDLARLLEHPSDADPTAIAVACKRIGRWSDDCGHIRTAAQFFQVAANARLSDAEYALEAARAARDLADYPRAEVWLQRAIGLARQAGQWETYTKCFLAFGTMFQRRGNMPAARRAVERAQRRAIRSGFQHLQAAASHDLLVIESTCGALERAEAHAYAAMRLYPQDDPRIRILAHDVGCLWLKTGNVGGALMLFRASLPLATDAFRPYVAGSMALAAGIAGSESDFWRAKSAVNDLQPAPGLSEAWAEVAEGALLLGLPHIAEQATSKASTIAASRREHRIEFTVEELQSRIVNARRMATTPEQPDLSEDVVLKEPVVRAFVDALQPA